LPPGCDPDEQARALAGQAAAQLTGGAATGPGLPLAASAASLPLAVRVARAVTVALAWALITQNLRPMNLPAKGTFKFAIMMSRPLRTTA
jgi:hypothetical protein